jgi:hypothetical protein
VSGGITLEVFAGPGAGMPAAGEDPAVVADEYGCTAGAVEAVRLWSERWPGAWL